MFFKKKKKSDDESVNTSKNEKKFPQGEKEKKDERENNKRKDNHFIFYFAETEFLNPEMLKEHKKIAKETFDGISYTLLSYKKNKLPKKYSSKYLALILYDIKSQSSQRGIFYNKKSKELILFTHDDGIEIKIDIVDMKDENDITTFSENYFLGYPYIVVTGNEKELRSTYQESNTVATAILFVILILFFGYVYVEFIQEDSQVVVTQTKTPKPIPKPLTPEEKHIMLNGLSLSILNNLKEELSIFEKRENLNIQRISFIRVNTITVRKPAEPRYIKDTNEWVYSDSDKDFKRGGFTTNVAIDFQKKFPSDGFIISSTGDKENIPMYKKTKNTTFSAGLKELRENNVTKTLDKVCLKQMLLFSDKVLPVEQNGQYIEFMAKKTMPSKLFETVEMLLEKCPAEIKTLLVSSGKLEIRMKLKK